MKVAVRNEGPSLADGDRASRGFALDGVARATGIGHAHSRGSER